MLENISSKLLPLNGMYKKNLSTDHLEFIVFVYIQFFSSSLFVGIAPNAEQFYVYVLYIQRGYVLTKLKIRVARAKVKIKAVNSKITVWHAKR